jgi:hypothetical protein
MSQILDQQLALFGNLRFFVGNLHPSSRSQAMSVLIRVHSCSFVANFLYLARCPILEMGLFGKIAFSRFSRAPFACFLLRSCGTFTLWNIVMEIECY